MTEKYYKGALPPHNPRKNKKHKRPLREKKPPSVKTPGCLIKALRHDEKGMSPLECIYCPLFVTPAIFKPLLACP
jgi:hypothetical protein